MTDQYDQGRTDGEEQSLEIDAELDDSESTIGIALGTKNVTPAGQDVTSQHEDELTGKEEEKIDAVLVFADADQEKAYGLMKEFNALELRDGSNVNVVMYDDLAFGVNIVERPSIICEKSSFIFIVHTENTVNTKDDMVANFTKDETVAQTRLVNLFHKSDAVRPLAEKHLAPIRGLASVARVPWPPTDDSAKKNLVHLFQYQRDEEKRRSDVTAERYEIKEKNRGICLIINNIEFKSKLKEEDIRKVQYSRFSAQWESDELKKLFTKMEYDVKEYKNLKSKDIEDIVEDIGKMDHTDYDSLICYFISHGKQDVIFGSDIDDVLLHQLFNHFIPTKCSSLKEKPKLIFLETCRGKFENPDDTERVDGMKALFGETPSPDFYICYATSPGHISMRNNETGDWFTQELIDALQTRSKGSDIIAILEHVKHQVSKRKMTDKHGICRTQNPDIINTLTKRFFFERPDNQMGKTIEYSPKAEVQAKTRTVTSSESTSNPFQEIGVDILGPFEVTGKGRCHVVILTDSVTQWAEADIIPCDSTEALSRCLVKFICTHGIPKAIITDANNPFYQAIQVVCSNNTIECRQPSGEQQKVNYNRNLCRKIPDFVAAKTGDWDAGLPYLMLRYRTTVNEVTGTDPFSQVYKRKARLPADLEKHLN